MGTNQGVYKSLDNGISWDSINTGLTSHYIWTLGINDTYLFANESNTGIWRLPLTALSIENINKNENSIAIFPNPATNTLTIQTPQKATLEITNIEGQIIKTFNITNPETTIDVSGLSGGVYIIKAQSDKGVVVRKFIKE